MDEEQLLIELKGIISIWLADAKFLMTNSTPTDRMVGNAYRECANQLNKVVIDIQEDGLC